MRRLVCWALFAGAGCLLMAPLGCRERSRRVKRSGPAVVVVDPQHRDAVTDAEQEPNDTQATAQRIGLDRVVSGTLGVRGAKDVDWFAVEVPTTTAASLPASLPTGVQAPIATQVLTATVSGSEGDLIIEAFSAAGKRLVRVDNTGAGEGERLINLAVAPPRAFLRISQVAKEKQEKAGKGDKEPGHGTTPERVAYRLATQIRALAPGEEIEPNYKRSSANNLALGEEATGYLGWRTDTDWFRIDLSDLSAGTLLHAELDGVDGVWAYLSIHDERGRLLQRRLGSPGDAVVLGNVLPPVGAKSIYLVVRCAKTFNAEMRYSLRAFARVYLRSEVEPNDAVKTATQLKPGEPLTGTLADHRDKDHYVVKIDQPRILRVTVTPPWRLDPIVELVDEAGKVIVSNNADSAGRTEVLAGVLIRPPRAILRVRATKAGAGDSAGRYRIAAEVSSTTGVEREPNDEPSSAGALSASTVNLAGYLHPEGDVDLFALAGRSGSLSVKLTPPDGVSVELSLLKADGKTVVARAASGADGVLTLVSTVDHQKRYLLSVRAKSGQNHGQRYRLEIGEAEIAPVGTTP